MVFSSKLWPCWGKMGRAAQRMLLPGPRQGRVGRAALWALFWLLVAPLPAGAFGGGSSIQPIVIQSAGAFLGGFSLICQHFPAMGPPTPLGAQPLWCCCAHVPALLKEQDAK